MTRKSNQKIEEYYFEMFRKDYVLPPGEVKYGDKPDVIIEGPKRIGVEITNFYIEDGSNLRSIQRQNEVRDNSVSEAQELYLGNRGKNIKIIFSFDNNNPIRNMNEFAKRLAELGKRIEKLEPGSVPKSIFGEIPELFSVDFYLVENSNAKWVSLGACRVSVMSRNRLVEIVKKKERKISAYENCDVYWLLVVVDFFDLAQDQGVPNDGFEKIKSLGFEKIIVYKPAENQILEAK